MKKTEKQLLKEIVELRQIEIGDNPHAKREIIKIKQEQLNRIRNEKNNRKNRKQ